MSIHSLIKPVGKGKIMNRVEHLLNVAYKNLNEEMQEAYPMVDLDEAIGCIAEALAIIHGDHGSFDQEPENVDKEFFNRITNNLLDRNL